LSRVKSLDVTRVRVISPVGKGKGAYDEMSSCMSIYENVMLIT